MLGHLHTTLIIAAVASMILTGCGGGQEALRTPTAGSGRSQRKDVEKRPMAFYESTLRPSIFDGDVDSVRKVHEQELEQQVLLIPRDSLTFQEETILGFRIQVASTSSIDDAATVKAAAQDLFRIDTVYVVYAPPVYKVRLGDFPTRLEANQRLPLVQEGGYPDAWVVPDRVIRRRWVAVGVEKQE